MDWKPRKCSSRRYRNLRWIKSWTPVLPAEANIKGNGSGEAIHGILDEFFEQQ